jgi:hypothetical protein
MPDTNSRYKQLSSEFIHKFESKRRALEENLRADSARVSSRQREVQESLRAAGFDVSKLESLLLRDKEDLPRRLEQILPPLVNPEKSTDGHNIKDTFSKIDVAGKAMLEPVAATLMSNNADFLRGNPVLERGNPWITSATPQILKIKVSVSECLGRSDDWSSREPGASLLWFRSRYVWSLELYGRGEFVRLLCSHCRRRMVQLQVQPRNPEDGDGSLPIFLAGPKLGDPHRSEP